MSYKNVKSFSQKNENLFVIMDGEDGVVGYGEQNHNMLGRAWFATFMAGMVWMAQQGMTGEQWNVLAYLLGHLDFDNWLRVKQKDICDTLGMTQSHVSRAISRLVELDIIAKGPLANKFNTYRLNPRIAHRGAKRYRSNIIQYDELQKRRSEKRKQEE